MTVPETANRPAKQPMILGLGGCGASVIDVLASFPGIDKHILALIDTDRGTVENSAALFKLNASSDWGVANGSGCGGDVVRGERSLARVRPQISEVLSRASFLLVVCGLGGGTATGGLRTIASVARSMNLPAAFLVTMPFSFEAYARQRNAEECVRELLPTADILLTLPNDLLYSLLPPDTPAVEAFGKAAGELARTVFGVAELMRCKSLLGADYAVLMNLVRGKRCDCSVGVGIAAQSDGLDRCAIALERMLSSPFLGGRDQLKKSDLVLLVLSGGNDLTLAEMKRTIEYAADVLPRNVETLSGACVSDALDGCIQLTAFAVSYGNPAEKPCISEPEELPDGTVGTDILTQPEFTLPEFSRGIFENQPPSKYGNEDLDIPTFQRRSIKIDSGKSS